MLWRLFVPPCNQALHCTLHFPGPDHTLTILALTREPERDEQLVTRAAIVSGSGSCTVCTQRPGPSLSLDSSQAFQATHSGRLRPILRMSV